MNLLDLIEKGGLCISQAKDCFESFNRFPIISLGFLICRYSP